MYGQRGMTKGRTEHDNGPMKAEKFMEKLRRTTEKTTTKSPRQVVLAYVHEKSCRFLHEFFHGFISTLLSFFLTVVLSLVGVLKTGQSESGIEGRTTRRRRLLMSPDAMKDASSSCVVSREMGLMCLIVLGMCLCITPLDHVLCPSQKSKDFCYDELMGKHWEKI